LNTSTSLVGGVVSMLGATVGSFGPALLLALGAGNAWGNRLLALEPLEPVFVMFTFGYMSFAFYDVYVFPRRCPPNEIPPSGRLTRQRMLFWTSLLAITAMALGSLVAHEVS
jgi:mercuric ion transport protein